MGYMYLDFEKKDGTMQRIFMMEDYKILRGFKEHMAPTFMSIKAWVEIPNSHKAYTTVDYRVEFSFGDFSKHSDEHHVTFDGVPRRHIRKLIIINVRTGNAEYLYEEGYGLPEPILFRNQFGRPVLTCATIEVKLNTTSRPTAEDKSKDEYMKIHVKLENGDYIPLYINANTVRGFSNYKCSLNAIEVAGYKEIPVTAEDRGDYRVKLNLIKDQGKYRILSVDARKVDPDGKPEQPLDTLIQVFYKVVDTVGNIGWSFNPKHYDKVKSGYVMKDKLDEILSKPDLEDMNNSYVSIFGRENDDPNAPLRHIATRRLCEIAIIPAYLYDSLNSVFDDDSNEADTTANKSCGCVSGGCENCDCDSECGTCSDPKQKEDNKDKEDDSQCDHDCNNCVVHPIFCEEYIRKHMDEMQNRRRQNIGDVMLDRIFRFRNDGKW